MYISLNNYQLINQSEWTFSKEYEVRLTKPALRRSKAGADDRKEKLQMYQDVCDRNAIESQNWNAEHRFGLDLISAKLDETAKIEVVLILTAMSTA